MNHGAVGPRPGSLSRSLPQGPPPSLSLVFVKTDFSHYSGVTRVHSLGLKTLLLLLALVGATAAPAQSLEILGPSGVVSPEGFAVAVQLRNAEGKTLPSRPKVTVEGGELGSFAPAPPLASLWILPRAGVREVKLRAVEGGFAAEARFAVGPPASRVELSLDPPAPVKGRDTHAQLSIRILRPDGTADPDSSPPVLRVNVGEVSGLTQVGPGTYRAAYALPTTRYPEVAILVALSPWPHPASIHGALGRLLVPLATRVSLPGRAERNAEVSIEIAGETFGPVSTGPDGRFSLPVVVPPGYGTARARAVDRFGNTRTRELDLNLPPTDQLACVANPTQLPADGQAKARILCAASDPHGKPVTSNTVKLSAERGTLRGPTVLDNGMLEWIYTSPRGKPGTSEVLLGAWKAGGPRSTEELPLRLVQGAAADLLLSAREVQVFAGGELQLGVKVTDALGVPRAGAVLNLRGAEGGQSRVEETAPGQFRGVWEVPASLRGPVVLKARASGPFGLEPSRLSAWIEDGFLRAAVVDLAGLPVPAQRLKVNGREVTTDVRGEVELGVAQAGRVLLSHAQWPALRHDVYVLEGGRVVFPPDVAPGTPVREMAVDVAPPAQVIPRVELREGGRVAWWIEDDHGRTLEGRRVEVALSNEPRPREAVSGRTPAEVEAGGSGPWTITISDVDAKVSVVRKVAR